MSQYFAPDYYELGSIPLGSRATASFNRVYGGPTVQSVLPGCHCTNAHWTNEVLTVDYYADKTLPEYIQQQGLHQYAVEKHLTVTYSDNTMETLFIRATVTA